MGQESPSGTGGALRSPDGMLLSETNTGAREFTYELVFVSEESRQNLEKTVAISLVKRDKDTQTGLAKLVFNAIFRPHKPIQETVFLVVTSATGGVWKFHMQLKATDPPTDGTLVIKAIGLDKVAHRTIKLHANVSRPESFKAFFSSTSPDPAAFSVHPTVGQLLPRHFGEGEITEESRREGSASTPSNLFTVGFQPNTYGKTYRATLVIQTKFNHWSYELIGTLPDYHPPQIQASPTGTLAEQQRLVATQHQGTNNDSSSRYRNFIRENLRPNTTGVSSPIKGRSVLPRHQSYSSQNVHVAESHSAKSKGLNLL